MGASYEVLKFQFKWLFKNCNLFIIEDFFLSPSAWEHLSPLWEYLLHRTFTGDPHPLPTIVFNPTINLTFIANLVVIRRLRRVPTEWSSGSIYAFAPLILSSKTPTTAFIPHQPTNIQCNSRKSGDWDELICIRSFRPSISSLILSSALNPAPCFGSRLPL